MGKIVVVLDDGETWCLASKAKVIELTVTEYRRIKEGEKVCDVLELEYRGVSADSLDDASLSQLVEELEEAGGIDDDDEEDVDSESEELEEL